ncbi:MAG: hypothetical protein LC687_07510, partial [Actinobacteria bacterium]|nr:hypothetical protein [Actinomycetota bacterium]
AYKAVKDLNLDNDSDLRLLKQVAQENNIAFSSEVEPTRIRNQVLKVIEFHAERDGTPKGELGNTWLTATKKEVAADNGDSDVDEDKKKPKSKSKK